MWSFRFLIVIVLAGVLHAETPVRRIREKMIGSLNNTPDFVCSESIVQTEHLPGKAPVTLPPLHVEAGVINGNELYAWPASEDDRARLRKILAVFAEGGSGSFALYSRAVFVTTDASFYGLVNESEDGASLSRTDFAMPQTASTYTLDAGGKPETLGYTGSIWMNPGTLETVRLDLREDDPPSASDIKSVKQDLEFGHTRFGPNTVVLPATTDFDLVERSGGEEHLVGHLSACRQYFSKSGDLFVETAASVPAEVAAFKPAAPPARSGTVLVPASVPVARAQGPLLPPGLELRTILLESLDERTTVQGSRLVLTVTSDLKVHGKLLVAKGATITGHVTRILRQQYPLAIGEGLKTYFLVGMRLESVKTGDKLYRVMANLESLGPQPPQTTNTTEFVPYSDDPNRWGTLDVLRTLFIVPKADPGESFLGVVYEYLRLHPDYVMYWKTLAPAGE